MTSSTNDSFMYFAYGSNLSQARLHLNNPSAEFYAVAKLKDYKLVFGCQEHWKSNRWHGGVASIEEQQGEEVWGVIWKLHNRDMANLDRQEGNAYRVIHVQVTFPENCENANEVNCENANEKVDHMICRTYQMKEIKYKPPSPQYKGVIVAGATRAQLPMFYMNQLNEFEDNGYVGPTILDEIGVDNL